MDDLTHIKTYEEWKSERNEFAKKCRYGSDICDRGIAGCFCREFCYPEYVNNILQARRN